MVAGVFFGGGKYTLSLPGSGIEHGAQELFAIIYQQPGTADIYSEGLRQDKAKQSNKN